MAGVRDAVPVLAVSAAICVVGALAIGQSALAMVVFLAVQAVFLLPRRLGLAVAAGLVVLEEALSRLVPGWRPVEGLAVSIALAAVAIWGVSGMIERNIALARAQATIAELAVQAERSRFARDLHDILGHSLTVITVKAELANRLIDLDPERARAEIRDLERLGRDALTDVRRAVHGYHDLTLPGELARAREALVAADIDAELPNSTDEVPSELRELFAWTVREGVTNVIRHSGATRCTVRLAATEVEVRDDGTGPRDPAAGAGTPDGDGRVATTGGGHGLDGLRERAAAVGAVLVTRPVDPTGFALSVVAP
jgi:two-component system sensor histidine kinase DesK